jgi:hypothetical protein
MGFSRSSKIFKGIRASTTALGLSDRQLGQIVAYVDRSPTFTKRMKEFEEIGGEIKYSDSDTNYFWLPDKTVYISPANYQNSLPGSDDAYAAELAGVLAHEMWHFISYLKDGVNPNTCASCDEAAAAGVRDEAWAYAQEYVVQCEVNARSGPRVDWMKEGQLEAIQPAVDALPPGSSGDALHLAAMKALLEWSANWTGYVESAGGYFEFYRNEWRKLAKEPPQTIEPRSVKIAFDDEGNVLGMEYRSAGTMIATSVSRDPATGTFA